MENRSRPSSWHLLDLETETNDVTTSPPHTGPSKHLWGRAEHREGKVARSRLFITVSRAHDQCSQSSFHPKSQKELLPRKHISFLPHNLKPPALSLLLLEIEMKFRSIVWYLLREKNGFCVSISNFFVPLSEHMNSCQSRAFFQVTYKCQTQEDHRSPGAQGGSISPGCSHTLLSRPCNISAW